MPLKIKSQEDFWSGVFFIALGVTAVYISRNYPMGSALRMGPGYFPTWLGALQIISGAVVFIRSFFIQGEGLGEWAFRPMFVLTGTILAFGMCMDQFELGFVPSLIVLIVGCALAHKDVHWVETIILAAFLTAGCVGLFIYGIGLPYRLFWWSY